MRVPKQKRQLLDVKVEKGFLVDYCDYHVGYRVYMPTKNNVVRKREVTFKDEQTRSAVISIKSVEELEQLVGSINVEQGDAEECAAGDVVHADAEGAARILKDSTQL